MLFNEEKIINEAIIRRCIRDNIKPAQAELEKLAKDLMVELALEGDSKNIIERALEYFDPSIDPGEAIVAENLDSDWWNHRKIKWIYTAAYEHHLQYHKGWQPKFIQGLNATTGKILGYLQDPLCEGDWKRRGLVIGHVQSGKTANYIGLIARAADAGYKFIIVIAGIHNHLRAQTQERIDEGFIGRTSAGDSNDKTGVGHLYPDYPHPTCFTSVGGDFDGDSSTQIGMQLESSKVPIIIVIKKQIDILNAVYTWLKQNIRKNIIDIPMLMIDDEADNASININKEYPEDKNYEPSPINGKIREILALFSKSCYVGYTATPFANIFIDPDAFHPQAREDIFPSDFIYLLEAADTYFGPDKIFCDDKYVESTIRYNDDCEKFLPMTHKSDYRMPKMLPESLREAFHNFIVAAAIRNCGVEGEHILHNTMLINVSHLTKIQDKVHVRLNEYWEDILDQKGKIKTSYEKLLKNIYEKEYRQCGVGWNSVQDKLVEVLEKINFYLVNSEYNAYPDYHEYPNAVVIGGFSLSRGLTLKGLCVSYVYRNSKAYDTLMQMGRWFGYWQGYEDICRIYLSTEAVGWYKHIAEKTEELRQQIRIMAQDKRTPRDFGLYVGTHPEKLVITDPKKMRRAEQLKLNFSAQLEECHILPLDAEINTENEQLIREFWEKSFGVNFKRSVRGWFGSDVALANIKIFLEQFKTHEIFTIIKSSCIQYLDKISDKYPKGDVLLVSIKDKDENPDKFNLGFQDRKAATRDEENKCWRVGRQRVGSAGIEREGLSEKQIAMAEKLAGKKSPSDIHYRKVRNKPFLMVHLLRLPNNDSKRVPAFGISFPSVDYDESSVDVRVNPTFIRQLSNLW